MPTAEDWESFRQASDQEAREAGFDGLGDVAAVVEDVLLAVGDTLSERQADALRLAADIVGALERVGQRPE